MMRIYLDHNATTPPDPRVIQAMTRGLDLGAACWGNPSSAHEEGRAARAALEGARRQVAALLRAEPAEVIFTSGGTEGNNAAILAVGQGGSRPAAVVSSPIEHPSVREALHSLAGRGVPVVLLPVDGQGCLDPEDLRQVLRERPVDLVSLSLCNHEIGNLAPIEDLARLCQEQGVPLHCDAVQAVGRVPVDFGALAELGLDRLTLSGHKFYGPKGIGALLCRERPGRETLPSLLHGGGQEKGRRAGTENLPGALGLGEACRLAQEALTRGEPARLAALRDRLEAQLLQIPGARRHGDPRARWRAPGVSNLGFAGVEGEVLMMNLDLQGVAVSTGAACSSGTPKPSPVLLALGLAPEQALEAVRFSLGAGSTEEQVDRTAALVAEIVTRVRGL